VAGGPRATSQGLPEVVAPVGNPVTAARVRLGTALFWDEQLSFSGTVACGSCHLPEAGGSDPRAWIDPESVTHPGPDGVPGTRDDWVGSVGVPTEIGGTPQITARRPRTMIGAAFAATAFWDGRAGDSFVDPDSGEVLLTEGAALETQALKPLLSEVEMNRAGRLHGEIMDGLARAVPLALSPAVPSELRDWIGTRGYPALFEEAFGDPQVTAARTAMAIASYQRTLIPSKAPVLDPDAWLSPLEREGQRVFEAKKCADCHDPTHGLFLDGEFHFIGQADPAVDPGRAAITGAEADAGKFLTPTLLNVALRAPYFHDGSKESLDEVLDFYTRGGDHGDPAAREIEPARFTGPERKALLAFLGRPLTDARVARAIGPFERPLLRSEAHGARITAAVRGISAPSMGFLRETPTMVRAHAARPFAAFLPAESIAILLGSPYLAIGRVPTSDLLELSFAVPKVVPTVGIFRGQSVLADVAPLFPDRRMRGTVSVVIETSTDSGD
ncbi:MAG: cytochrome c peroxidase, partial [Planctomycetota bacterium]